MGAGARLVTMVALALSAVGVWAADANKVLRVASYDISGLDPQQISDLYSVRIAQQIFEGLYEYSYLEDPVRVIPNTAAALPEIRRRRPRWTIRLRQRASGSAMILCSRGSRGARSPPITSTR
jgi:ABC-type oligopeptide transport system substrate-binding subunit